MKKPLPDDRGSVVISIFDPYPSLELTPADIRALTDGDLGKKIKEIAKSDEVFKEAFAQAIKNPVTHNPPQPK